MTEVTLTGLREAFYILGVYTAIWNRDFVPSRYDRPGSIGILNDVSSQPMHCGVSGTEMPVKLGVLHGAGMTYDRRTYKEKLPASFERNSRMRYWLLIANSPLSDNTLNQELVSKLKTYSGFRG